MQFVPSSSWKSFRCNLSLHPAGTVSTICPFTMLEQFQQAVRLSCWNSFNNLILHPAGTVSTICPFILLEQFQEFVPSSCWNSFNNPSLHSSGTVSRICPFTLLCIVIGSERARWMLCICFVEFSIIQKTDGWEQAGGI